MARVAAEAQPAWILHARAYRETSLLVDALTLEGGRVAFIARGVRGARAQGLRASLQPFQPLRLALTGRGELPMLASTDVHAAAPLLTGRALLAGFYLNELLLRLLPRHEPSAPLFWRYGATLDALAAGGSAAWPLRRFERDLLVALGHAPRFDAEADDGPPVAPEGRYRIAPERGPLRVAEGDRASVSGAALLALADDGDAPDALALELRRAMRPLIAALLGGRALNSWQMIVELDALEGAGGASG